MIQGIGGIYSDQRCTACGKSLVDDCQVSLRCPDHPYSLATSFKVKIRGTTARFSGYFAAKDYLYAARKAMESGYMPGVVKEMTLGHVQDKFLDWKRDLVKMGRLNTSSVNAYKSRLCRIVDTIGVSTVASSVRYRDVHEFLYKSGGAPKSIYDSYTIFKEMIEWAFDMGDLTAKPKWPPFEFSLEHDMERRKTVDKETQARILHDIYKREWEIRPRLYIAIRFLSTYISLRPSELLHIKEKDLDREMGLLTITSHKTSQRPKVLRLLPEDVGFFRQLPRGMPDMPLFRYDVPCGAIRAGAGFGQAAFYRAWKRACKNLGIEGVDLYGGTRHSSAIALYKDAGVSPEEIKKATGHKTSVAFTRYFKLDIDDVLEIHALAGPPEPEPLKTMVRWEKNVR